MTTDHEAKAREIVLQILDHDIEQGRLDHLKVMTIQMVDRIATALREEQKRGQNDVWLWLDEHRIRDANAQVKTLMAQFERELIRSTPDE